MPGRRRDRLPVTLTLLLELIAAFVLSLVLADPRFGEWDRASHLVAVLDHSASMQGQPAGEVSFRDAALRELEQRFAALPRSSKVTLIRTGVTPVTLVRRGTVAEAREVLQTWQPTAAAHRFAPAWEELGQQLIEESGTILFLTDQFPDRKEIPPRLEVVSVGRKLDNVAFDAARWTFDSATGAGKIFMRVKNYGRDPADCLLTVSASGKLHCKKALLIPPDQAISEELVVPGGLGSAKVEIQKQDDGLKFDNQIQLVEPKVRSVNVAVTFSKGDESREVQRVLKITPDINFTTLDQANLSIGAAATLPQSKANLWWLGIGPVSVQEADRRAAKDLLGPYLIDKRHPLTEGLALGGVVWGGVQPLKYDLVPIISVGQIPLLAQLRGTLTTAFILNIDLARSNITESPDWPVLIDNLVEQRREAMPGLRRWNYRLGEVVRFRLFEGTDLLPSQSLIVTGPGGARKLAREAVVEIGNLQDPGIYTIDRDEEKWGQFAVNFFDSAESDLRNLHPGHHEVARLPTDSGITVDNPYTWAIWAGTILILMLLFGDWFVLRTKPLRN